ncbi:DB module domain-containing protein [Ditylenchus destructor]|uniref:DB module domain-containing protein n=1 Tax=Ditylenchus destructor TaxID=166010 RepID=A0AAD4ML04_9BILA|nr:DB module domain-containing protein [Ditylenchus destructor]
MVNYYFYFSILCVMFLFPGAIFADKTKDSKFHNCCLEKGVLKEFADRFCTYTNLYNELLKQNDNPIDGEVFNHVAVIAECGSEQKDNTQCCASKGISDKCKPCCNGRPPINIDAWLPCIGETKTQMKTVLDCHYHNAYNSKTFYGNNYY